MMSKSLQLLVFLLLGIFIFSFSSCTKDLEFGETKRKLIINAPFQVGKTFQVKLKTSRNILDANSINEKVSDAYVAIKDEDGKLLEVLKERNNIGLYVSSDKLTAFQGKKYSLEVTHPKWPESVFTATSSAPELGGESTIDTTSVLISDALALKVNVLVDDVLNQNDLYIFEVKIDDKGTLAELQGYSEDVSVYGNAEAPKRLFLNDNNFNGRKKSLGFVTDQLISENYPNTIIADAEIRMVSASNELFEYFKSLEEYELAQNSIGSKNTSAVRIYSNIKESGVNKGFGIFAGYNVKSLVIR